MEKFRKHVSIVWKTPETFFHCVETFFAPLPPSLYPYNPPTFRRLLSETASCRR